MSSVAFTCFRALTRFGDLPLGAKLLRVTCFPYFLAKAAFSKDDTPPGARQKRRTLAVRAKASSVNLRRCVLRRADAAAVTTPYKSLHELPSLEAVDPATQARGRWRRCCVCGPCSRFLACADAFALLLRGAQGPPRAGRQRRVSLRPDGAELR
jgi:hypothetical protein